MTPSIDTRLQAVMGALEHLVLPALSRADSIVQEQASLVLGHLGIIRSQLRHLGDYQLICLNEMLVTGRALLAVAAGGEATSAAKSGLESAVQEVSKRFGDADSAAEDRNRVATAIDQLIIASSIDGSESFVESSRRVLVEHGARQSRRDRTWYRDQGLDPLRDQLGTIEQLIESDRIDLGKKGNT